jgi:hypothetical protein
LQSSPPQSQCEDLQQHILYLANENKITGVEAAKLIMKQKYLLKKAADEIGTEDEARLYYWIKDLVDTQEKLIELNEAREREERQQQKNTKTKSKIK